MKNTKILQFALLSIVAVASTHSVAQEAQGGTNVIYIGSGAAQTGNALKSSAAPASIGYMGLSNTKDAVWGLDYGAEGTMLESNGTRTTIKQGSSLNLLLGKNLTKGENTRFDAGFLVGMRSTSSLCPTSYLGYQCYADKPPETSYGFNYGVVATITYRSLTVGLRATGESAQGIIGFRF